MGLASPTRSGAAIAAGAVDTTELADEAVTNAKLAHMAQALLKGRAAAAGTGDATDLTATQVRTILNVADGAEVNPDVISQAEAEAGTATTERIFTAQRVAQAIAALAGGGVTTDILTSAFEVTNSSTLADSGLSMAIGASSTVAVGVYVLHRMGPTAANAKISLVASSGTLRWNITDTGSITDVANSSGTSKNTGITSAAQGHMYVVPFVLWGASGSATVKVQLAQQTADAGTTEFRGGGLIIAEG